MSEQAFDSYFYVYLKIVLCIFFSFSKFIIVYFSFSKNMFATKVPLIEGTSGVVRMGILGPCSDPRGSQNIDYRKYRLKRKK